MDSFLLEIPSFWQSRGASSVDVQSDSVEFQKISAAISNDGYKLVTLTRHQQLHRYALFFIREKFLMTVNPTCQYYRVRKYVIVPEHMADLALETNLDKRRCRHNFVMSSHIDRRPSKEGFLIFIVCIVTWDCGADVLYARKSSDYFIEYICRVRKKQRLRLYD